MKKIFFSLSILAIALTTSSCINDLDEGQTPGANDGGQAITFKAWANKQTRAAPTTVATINDFAVLATNPSAAAQVLIDGEVVSGGNGNWTYSPIAFWPDVDAVNFFAVSPAAANNVTDLSGATGTSALTSQNDVNTGEPGIEYTLPTALADQEDLLVAHHTGTYATEGTSGVPLNFHHALSRIKFQARSESGSDFKVKSIVLKNLKGKATLDLSTLPKDDRVFAYPIDDATLTSPGYQTYWVPDGSTVVDLDAALTTEDVLGTATGWIDIVDNADALYVIPQTNTTNSDYPYSTKLLGGAGSGASTGFYIEITYTDVLLNEDVTYAVPVKAIVGSDPDASSLAFEIERQYTFRFELSCGKPIKFTDVTVCDYDEADPLPTMYTAAANGSRFVKSDTVKLVFNEAVTGLTAADFTIAGTLGAATPVSVTGSGTSWNLVVNPTATGPATVRINKTGVNPDPKNIFIQSPFIEMVEVAGGGTQLGTPAQTVQLSTFYIGKYELTQKQWTDVMSAWPGTPPTTSVGDNFPAYYISWNDLVGTYVAGTSDIEYTEKGIDYYTNGFCYKLTVLDFGDATGLRYRLPTEAEWEYAAKGGQKTTGFTYSGSNTIDDVGWYTTNAGGAPHAVGTKAANELGIFDMSGNVWEWCGDWYYATYPSGTTDPTGVAGPETNRVLRGGSWNTTVISCTVSYRSYSALGYRGSAVGFRLALTQ